MSYNGKHVVCFVFLCSFFFIIWSLLLNGRYQSSTNKDVLTSVTSDIMDKGGPMQWTNWRIEIDFYRMSYWTQDLLYQKSLYKKVYLKRLYKKVCIQSLYKKVTSLIPRLIQNWHIGYFRNHCLNARNSIFLMPQFFFVLFRCVHQERISIRGSSRHRLCFSFLSSELYWSENFVGEWFLFRFIWCFPNQILDCHKSSFKD